MDMSKFLDDNFDAKEWVNEAFRAHKDTGITKDQHATSLVMKLQKFIQEVSGVIEETSQQALQNLPRVMREIDAVRQEAVLLKEQMRTVKHDIQKVEENTSKSMQSLLNLDMIKGRIKEASDALKEADNWTTLAAGVDDVFQSQDVNAIRDKLVGMQQSLQMLVDTPDYKDRCQYLEQLKNRLEALLSPQLVAAFNAQSLEPAQLFTRIFTDIDRLPQLHKYYHKCQKGQLLQSWTTLLETNPDAALSDWMTGYFDLLQSTWYSQLKWCGQVFDDPVPIVCDLMSGTLNSLDPALGTLIGQRLQQHGNVLGTLTVLHEISERFDKSMEKAVEAQVADSAYLADSLRKLREAIYAPYKPYMDKYRAFEEATLENELEHIPLDKREVLDTVQLLGQSVNRLFTLANQANDRCLKLSTGCCYLFLLEALKTYFSSYTHEFRRVLSNIREKCLAGPRTLGQEEDDWTHFQQSLRIIQTCGELILRLDELDQRIIMNILSSLGRRVTITSPTVRPTDEGSFPFVSPLHLQASLLLSNSDDIIALESMVVRLEEGDMTFVLADVKADFCQLSEDVHKFAFDIVFAQLKIYLTGLADMEIWKAYSAGGAVTSDLPTYSLSPQEYITKIGQYLLTVPQQLEPFTLQENAAVLVALKHGRLPYTDEQELPEHTADLWLESIAQGTMHVYSEEILRILEITTHATKQLCTDIAYLCNVLEDLGLHPSEMLTNIEQLLKVAPEHYKDIAETMPQRLSHAVSGMRSIEI